MGVPLRRIPTSHSETDLGGGASPRRSSGSKTDLGGAPPRRIPGSTSAANLQKDNPQSTKLSGSVSIRDLRAVAQSNADLYSSSSSEEEAIERIQRCFRPILEESLPSGFDPGGAVVISDPTTRQSIRVLPAQPPSDSLLAVIKRMLGLSSSLPSDVSYEAREVLYMSLFPAAFSNRTVERKSFFEDLVRGIGSSTQPLEIAQFLTSRQLTSMDARRKFSAAHITVEAMIAELVKNEVLFGRLVVLTHPIDFSPHVLAHACNIQFSSNETEWQQLFDSLRAKAVSKKIYSIIGRFPFQKDLEELFDLHPQFIIPVLKTLEQALLGNWGAREVQLLRGLFKKHPQFTLLGYQLMNRLHFHPVFILSHILNHPDEQKKPLHFLSDILNRKVLEIMEMPPIGALPFSLKITFKNRFEVELELLSPSHLFYEKRVICLSYPCRREDLQDWCESKCSFDLGTSENERNLSPSILVCQALGEIIGKLYAYSTAVESNSFKVNYVEQVKRTYCELMDLKESQQDQKPFQFLLKHHEVCDKVVAILEMYSLIRSMRIVRPDEVSKITSEIALLPLELHPLFIVISEKIQALVATNQRILLHEFEELKEKLAGNRPPKRKNLEDVALAFGEETFIENELLEELTSFFKLCIVAAVANSVYGFKKHCLVSQGREGLEENKKLEQAYTTLLKQPLPAAIRIVLEKIYGVAYTEWIDGTDAIQKEQILLGEVKKTLSNDLKRLGIEIKLDSFEDDENFIRGLAEHVSGCVKFRTGCMQNLRYKTPFDEKAEQFGQIQKEFLEFVQSFNERDDFQSIMLLSNTVLQATYPTNIQVLTDMMVLACRSGRAIQDDPSFSRAARNLNTPDCPHKIPADIDYWDLALYLRGYIPKYNGTQETTKKIYSCFRVETDTPYSEKGQRVFKKGDFVIGYATDRTVVEIAIPLNIESLGLDFVATDQLIQELATFTQLESSSAKAYAESGFVNHPYISLLQNPFKEKAMQLFVDFRKQSGDALARVFFHSTSRLDLTGGSAVSSRKVRGTQDISDVKVVNLSDEVKKLREIDGLLIHYGLNDHISAIRPFYRDSAFCEALLTCFQKRQITDKTMFLGKIRELSLKIWSTQKDDPASKQARKAFQEAVKQVQGMGS